MTDINYIGSVTIATNYTSRDTDEPDIDELSHVQLHLAAVIALALVAVYGTIGNILIVAAVTLKSRLRKRSNAFVVNLSLTDFLVCAYVMPLGLVTSQLQGFPFNAIICEINGFITVTLCTVSVQTLMLVAIERYFHICQVSRYRKWFTPQKIAMLLIATWVYSATWSIQGFTGWTRYAYSSSAYTCIMDTSYSITFNIAFASIAIMLPIIITVICYLRIFTLVCNKSRAMRNHAASIRSSSAASPNQEYLISKRQKRKQRKEVNIAVMLIVIIVVVVMFWLPAIIVISFASVIQIPRFLQSVAIWMAFSNSSANSLVYGIMNKNFRVGYLTLLNKVFRCRINTEDQVDWALSHLGARDTNTNTYQSGSRVDIRLNSNSMPSSTNSCVIYESSFASPKSNQEQSLIPNNGLPHNPKFGTHLNVPLNSKRNSSLKKPASLTSTTGTRRVYGLEALFEQEPLVTNPLLPQIQVMVASPSGEDVPGFPEGDIQGSNDFATDIGLDRLEDMGLVVPLGDVEERVSFV